MKLLGDRAAADGFVRAPRLLEARRRAIVALVAAAAAHRPRRDLAADVARAEHRDPALSRRPPRAPPRADAAFAARSRTSPLRRQSWRLRGVGRARSRAGALPSLAVAWGLPSRDVFAPGSSLPRAGKVARRMNRTTSAAVRCLNSRPKSQGDFARGALTKSNGRKKRPPNRRGGQAPGLCAQLLHSSRGDAAANRAAMARAGPPHACLLPYACLDRLMTRCVDM